MGRSVLTVSDRVEISTGLKAGWTLRAIAAHIERAPSAVSRDIRRNATKTKGYRLVAADCRAELNRSRPQVGKVAVAGMLRTRVLADLGRLLLEAGDPSIDTVIYSPTAGGTTASHEAIYRLICALPKGELAKHGVMLRSKRSARKASKSPGSPEASPPRFAATSTT